MKRRAIAVILLFGVAVLAPAGVAFADGFAACGFGSKALQAKKDVKEIEAHYATMVKHAKKDGTISEIERVTLDFYRLDNGMSLARAKAIESGS